MLGGNICYHYIVVFFLLTSLVSFGDGRRPPRSVAGRVPGLPSYVTVDGFNMARDGLRPMHRAPDDNSRIPGRYIVVMKDTSGSDAVQDVMGKYRYTVLSAQSEGRRRGHPDVIDMFHMEPVDMNMNILKGFIAEMTPSDVSIMRTMPDVEYIEEDQVFEKQSAVPWHLDRIDQQDLPLDGLFNRQPKFVSEAMVCPAGYHPSGDACFKAFDKAKKYGTAEAVCEGEGGILAEPRNRAVNEFLFKLLTSLNPGEKLWIGLTDREKEGTWRWNNGEELDRNSFTAWAEGKPNQAGDCAVVKADSKWNDVPCRWRHRFICQRPAFGKDSVDVYIVDSGIRYTHEEFEGRAVWSGFDAHDADGSNKGNDLEGHGTHVAALVGGRTFGVNPRVLLRSVRVLDSTGGGTSSVLRGLNHIGRVSSNSGARGVVVMSLTSRGGSPSVDKASRRLVLLGLPVVVAAGNYGDDACNHSPAREAEVITVGGTRITDGLYDRTEEGGGATSYGSCVDIFAPAQEVWSADVKSQSCNNCSDVRSGTSQAAPITAGVVTKLLSRDPSLTPAQIRLALLSTAAKNKLDFSTLPDDARLKTPNKLLQVPTVPLKETAACRTVWSLQSDREEGSVASAACNVNETLLSCASVTDGVHTGEFTEVTLRLMKNNGKPICVAENAKAGSSVYALARCCVLPGSLKCYIKTQKPSNKKAISALAKCDQNPRDVLTGCSVSGDGGVVRHIRGQECLARGKRPEAHAFCCRGNHMDCWKVRSQFSLDDEVVARCHVGSVLTGCSTRGSEGAPILGTRAVDMTCIAHKPPDSTRAIQAIAICCSVKKR
ncbi:PREDICTED: proprotein convertase subtilisin/kexin type 9-like [Branchiostoma belcheri]|uniref:Proprotein convertase subtilisin/kexin type 9 n=1 Tax=Branchiostoma belcheri TaxID=7741 RepID=A0A6P4Z654_BRABE|nr:PREDICTED: proprotein convertase subtilisin/kexin type 9-like [Branchiostoma belcheri]